MANWGQAIAQLFGRSRLSVIGHMVRVVMHDVSSVMHGISSAMGDALKVLSFKRTAWCVAMPADEAALAPYAARFAYPARGNVSEEAENSCNATFDLRIPQAATQLASMKEQALGVAAGKWQASCFPVLRPACPLSECIDIRYIGRRSASGAGRVTEGKEGKYGNADNCTSGTDERREQGTQYPAERRLDAWAHARDRAWQC